MFFAQSRKRSFFHESVFGGEFVVGCL